MKIVNCIAAQTLMITLLFPLKVQASINKIAIIKVNKEGKEEVKVIKTKILKPKVIRLLSTINNSVQEQTYLYKSNKMGWKISHFSVGIGALGLLQVGPWVLAATAKQRMIFSRVP